MVCDDSGFAIYFTLDDQIIECGAGDKDYGDPATDWPAWCDEFCWSHIDPPDQAELPAISGGAPAFEPTDADWDDFYAASYGFGDDDIAAGGLAVG
jgi:hypothetical protein